MPFRLLPLHLSEFAVVLTNGTAIHHRRSVSSSKLWESENFPPLPSSSAKYVAYTGVFGVRCGCVSSVLAVDENGFVFHRVHSIKRLATVLAGAVATSLEEDLLDEHVLRNAHWTRVGSADTVVSLTTPVNQLTNSSVLLLDAAGRPLVLECMVDDSHRPTWFVQSAQLRPLTTHPRFDYGFPVTFTAVFDYGNVKFGSLFGTDGHGRLLERTHTGVLLDHHHAPHQPLQSHPVAVIGAGTGALLAAARANFHGKPLRGRNEYSALFTVSTVCLCCGPPLFVDVNS
jgi:hypothetical protein